MDKTALVEQDIDAGQIVLRSLDDSGFPVVAALWLWVGDLEKWRFLLASPFVDSDGPRSAYQKLQKVLRSEKFKTEVSSDTTMTLLNAHMVSPTDRMVQALSKAVDTKRAVSKLRFSRNMIDDVFIEDALIYRVDAKSIRSYRTGLRVAS